VFRGGNIVRRRSEAKKGTSGEIEGRPNEGGRGVGHIGAQKAEAQGVREEGSEDIRRQSQKATKVEAKRERERRRKKQRGVRRA
jgi:hypothetical protein